MAIEMSQELLRELKEMVVTCGEFKETVLKILEALFVPGTRERNKKLSFFDGRSFDKMYQKINDLIGKKFIGIIPEDVHKKLLKILKEYKGKKSPYKLMAVRKVIGFLEEPDPNSTKKRFGKTKYKSRTYGELQKNVSERLEPLYGREEVYANKEESKNEVELWDKIYCCVSKWHDGDPIDNEKYSQIKGCFDSYKNKISEDKEFIFKNIVLQLNNVAFRYEEHHKRMSKYNKKVVQEARELGEKYNEFKAIELFETRKKRKPEENTKYKQLGKYFYENFEEVVGNLQEIYFDFSGEDIQSLHNISNSFLIYSAHRNKGSIIINRLCDYLLAGIDVIFCSECFYGKFANQSLNANTLNGKNAEEIEDQLKKQLDGFKKTRIDNFTGKYNVKEIKTFIENLKKGKF